MIKRALAVAALSFFVATAAFAGTCPLMVQEIDEALASDTSVSAEEGNVSLMRVSLQITRQQDFHAAN